MEGCNDVVRVGATVFDIWGKAATRVTVSEGAAPIHHANPVSAALPGGRYAVAWSDFDVDGSDLGVALRAVAAGGSVGELRAANASGEFSQLNPDTDLNAISGDEILANTGLPEAAVALASFNGGWAAAYREGAVDGNEHVVVRVGADSFRVWPVLGGPIDDRPALVELDATHLLVVLSADPMVIGTTNVARIRYAVIDTESAAAPVLRSLDPMDDVLTSSEQTAQLSPAVERSADGAYIAWRSEARPGDAAGDQLWLKHLRWVPDGASFRLHAEESELLIPRTCDESVGDQRAPALASTHLPPGGGLAIAWNDFGRTLGAGEPEVLVHYAPTHMVTPEGAPQTLVETWSGPTGSAWPARWSSNAAPPVTLSTQFGEGEVNALGNAGSVLAWVNDHTAVNVDIVTTVRFNNDVQHIGAFARRGDSSPNSYVAALINTKTPDVWRTYSVAPDAVTGLPVATVLQSMPVPKGFPYKGVGKNVDYRFRFRVATSADGSVFVGMKAWRLGANEPITWLLESSHARTSSLALQLGSAAGRFGVLTNAPTANGGRMWFDDFSATFFEGDLPGDLDIATSTVPLLLPREVATYRRCNANSPCTVADGCCAEGGDCATGLACDRGAAESLGVGSHASTCVAAHCADSKKGGTETRADCGGPDCKACSCTSTVALGAAGYCSTACRCGMGEYPCSRNENCLPGVVCGADAGEPFGSAFGVDACVPPHCVNRVLDADKNETAIDCGGECGSNCAVCSPTNGLPGHCRPYCQCTAGHGHCLNDLDCAPSLLCGVAEGHRYGFGPSVSICLPAHCLNNRKDTALGETSIDCGGECSNAASTSCPQ